jgi:peptidoglycan/LPS O-acetylase OafA/YrhL
MRRVPELDGLRAIAALAVIGLHVGIVAPSVRIPLLEIWGSTAVDLFFVISGFLITTIILRERGSKGFFLHFYARRSLRIWPIYYLSLLGFVVLNRAIRSPFPTNGLAFYLTYTQNVSHYWFATPPAFCKAFAHTWSLAVEEQFYLLWPALVCLVGRRGLVPLCLSLIVLANLARGIWHFDSQLLLTRCDGLALGGLLAAVLEAGVAWPGKQRLLERAFSAVCATSFGYLAWLTVSHSSWTLRAAAHPGGFTPAQSITLTIVNLAFFGAVGICYTASGCRALGWLRARPLRYLGEISYGLYLYHNLIFGVAQKLGGRLALGPGAVAACLALTVGAAALSWQVVERPLLSLKAFFSYREAPGPATARGRLKPIRPLAGRATTTGSVA